MKIYEFARVSIASCVMLLATVAMAAGLTNNEINEKVTQIGDAAYGVQVHKVKGATAEEMVRNLAIASNGDDDGFILLAESDQLDFADQSGWGTIRPLGARSIYSWMDEKTDENGDAIPGRDDELDAADELIKELGDAGLEFGFTSGSSSYCGVSFMGLLIVDVKRGVIYEISLTSSGPC